MKRLKWVLSLVTENLGWKLLSLAIAVVVWGLVANEPELSTFATAGLEFKNLPEELEISSDPVSTVKLELKGPSGVLRELGQGAQPQVILDMSATQTGEHTFAIASANVKLPRGIELVRSIPPQVRFRFERRATRSVKVTPRFAERAAFEVAGFDVTPESLEIVGPASRAVWAVSLRPSPIPSRSRLTPALSSTR